MTPRSWPPVVADGGRDGLRLRERLRGEMLVAPDLLRVEITSVVRRHANTGQLTAEQTDAAIRDLLDLPITVFPTAGQRAGSLLRRGGLTLR